MGILVALLEREVSGEGQWVQSSLLGAQISLLDFQAARWLVAKDIPGQAGNDHPTSIPTGVFPTRDGHINIAASGKHIFKWFCQTLDLGHLLEDRLFADDASRSTNRVALNKAISHVTKQRSSSDLIAMLNNAGVPCGPTLSGKMTQPGKTILEFVASSSEGQRELRTGIPDVPDDSPCLFAGAKTAVHLAAGSLDHPCRAGLPIGIGMKRVIRRCTKPDRLIDL